MCLSLKVPFCSCYKKKWGTKAKPHFWRKRSVAHKRSFLMPGEMPHSAHKSRWVPGPQLVGAHAASAWLTMVWTSQAKQNETRAQGSNLKSSAPLKFVYSPFLDFFTFSCRIATGEGCSKQVGFRHESLSSASCLLGVTRVSRKRGASFEPPPTNHCLEAASK